MLFDLFNLPCSAASGGWPLVTIARSLSSKKFAACFRLHDGSTKGLVSGSTQNLSIYWGVPMLRRAPDSEEIRLRELKGERKSLWRRFEDNPNEVHIAAKLKFIDDQIAELNQPYNRGINKIDDFEVAAVPEVNGLFLLLGVSQRRGS
jgi:hypothetical protein